GLVAQATVEVDAQLAVVVKAGATQIATAIAAIAPDALLSRARAAIDDVLAGLAVADPDTLAASLALHYAAVVGAYGKLPKSRVDPTVYAQLGTLVQNGNPLTGFSPLSATQHEVVTALTKLRDALQPADLGDVYASLKPRLSDRVPSYVSATATGASIETEWQKLDPAPVVAELRS